MAITIQTDPFAKRVGELGGFCNYSRVIHFEKEDITHGVKQLFDPLELFCDKELKGKAELSIASYPPGTVTCSACVKAMPENTVGP